MNGNKTKYKMIVTREVVTAYYVEAKSLQDIEDFEFDVYDQDDLDSEWAEVLSVEEIGT